MNTDEVPRFWNIWQCIVHGWVGLINGPAHAYVCHENVRQCEYLEQMLKWPTYEMPEIRIRDHD